MKNSIQFFALVAFMLTSLFSSAVIRYVNNTQPYPGTGLHYTNISDAIGASSTNSAVYDTIYVEGSPTSYGNFTVTEGRYVRLFGTGHNPESNPPLVSQLGNVTLDEATYMVGFVINKITLNLTNEHPTFERCRIVDRVEDVVNWCIATFNGCIFSSSGVNVDYNGVDGEFRANNCIFNGQITEFNTAWPILINRCIFLGTVSPFNTTASPTVTNSIFYRSSPNAGSGASTSYSYCTSYQCANNNFQNGGSNNLVNSNPEFVNFPPAGAFFDYTHDFNILSGPSNNSGSDFTDRGVYGGTTTVFTMTGTPAIPTIQLWDITNPTVGQGENLNVNFITTRKQ